jgi:SAM-dependent methyltransferase
VPAPRWFFRFIYDRESGAWARQRNGPTQLAAVEQLVDELTDLVAAPGPIADLGCGPGTHALALARRGYSVVGVDGSPGMIDAASAEAATAPGDVSFEVLDVSEGLDFADASLGGALAINVVQHLHRPASFISEVRRCLRPGGHLLIAAPVRCSTPLSEPNTYWRVRAALYQGVPGVVRFYSTDSLARLVESGGFSLVGCRREQSRVIATARA